MRIFTLALLASLGSATLASAAAPIDCTTFLTGQWEGKWSGDMFGHAALFEAKAIYNDDGTFQVSQTVSPADPAMAGTPPMLMSSEGTWKAASGEDENTCLVDLEGTAQMGDMTGMTPTDQTIIRVDDDTIRNGGTLPSGAPAEDGDLTRVKD